MAHQHPLRFMGDALERLNTVVDFELFRADLERAVPRLALRVSSGGGRDDRWSGGEKVNDITIL